MAEKLSSDWKIEVFPLSAIDALERDSFCIQDTFSGYVLQQQGEGGSTSDQFAAAQWQQQRAFESISANLEFVRFLKDGTLIKGAGRIQENEGMGGFTLKPSLRLLNNVMVTPQPGDPHPDNGYDTIKWRPVQGDSWETYVPGVGPYRNFIRHRGQVPNATISADTSTLLPAWQGFSVTFDWIGVCAEHTTDPGVRLMFCGNNLYSIVWRKLRGEAHNKPTLERMVNGQWQTWKLLTYDGDGDITFTGREVVTVRPLAGYMVVTINGHSWWMANTTTPRLPTSPTQAVDIAWPRGRVKVNCYGVVAQFGLATVDYLDTNKAPTPGTFARRIRRRLRNIPYTPVDGYAGGWAKQGASSEVFGTPSATAVHYQVTMRPSSNGIASPFVSSALLYFRPEMAGESPSAIDLRPAVQTISYTTGSSEGAPMARAQITLSRKVLDAKVPGWTDTLVRFAPIKISQRWRYTDQSADTFQTLFEGYVYSPDPTLEQFNAQTMDLVAFDPTMRLKEPAALVDDQYAPLDWIVTSGQQTSLYGGQGVKAILAKEMGDVYADTLNGDGDSMRFMPPGHYPLVTSAEDGGGYFGGALAIPTKSGANLPPPFGSDAISWIHTLAGFDRAVFFFTHSLTGDTIIPVYGRPRQVMAVMGGAPLELPDAIYSSGDSNKLVASASVKNLVDKAINEVQVWIRKGEGLLAVMRPALYIGRSSLPDDDPNSGAATWRRSRVLKEEIFEKRVGQDFAQLIADVTLAEFEGVTPRDVSLTLPRGDISIRWARLVKPKFSGGQSDSTIGIDGEVFRVKRVEHKVDLTGANPEREFVTEVIARPLSATGF